MDQRCCCEAFKDVKYGAVVESHCLHYSIASYRYVNGRSEESKDISINCQISFQKMGCVDCDTSER